MTSLPNSLLSMIQGSSIVSNDNDESNVIKGPWRAYEDATTVAVIHAVYDKESRQILTSLYGDTPDLVELATAIVKDISDGAEEKR